MLSKLYISLFITAILSSCDVSVDRQYQQNTSNPQKSFVVELDVDDPNAKASTRSNFYFMIDVSGSMDGECAGKTKMEGAKESVIKFVTKIPNDANIGLLLFGTSNDVEEVISLGNNNKREFIELVSKLEANGGTPLGAATKLGVDKLTQQYKKQMGYGDYRLIIVSDGAATSESSFKRALDYSRKHSFVSIYGIGLCMQSDKLLKSYSVQYSEADDYDKLSKALEQTVGELPTFDVSDFE